MSTYSNTDTSSTATTAGLDVPTLTKCIDNARRRAVIRLVGGRPVGTYMKLGELATDIAAVETGKHPSAVTSSERKRVYVALYQSHIEKLADNGLVVRRDGDEVVCTETTKTALDALETLDILLGEGGASA